MFNKSDKLQGKCSTKSHLRRSCTAKTVDNSCTISDNRLNRDTSLTSADKMYPKV